MPPLRAWPLWLLMVLPGLLAAQGVPAPAGPSSSGEPLVEMNPEAMRLLMESQDALFQEDYAACADLIGRAQATDPGHPLPRIFQQSLLIYQLQVNQQLGRDTRALRQRLETTGDAAVSSAQDYSRQSPGPVAELYLGGALGARGLGHLYEGSYVVAYRDGKKAYRLLRQCVAEEPRLYNAYVGLGTFEYESGRLAGVLQYILNLHGNVDYGLELLRTCEKKASYAAPTAFMNLARIYTFEVPNPAFSQFYLSRLYSRYARNPSFAQWCAQAARRAGWVSPEARAFIEPVLDQWEQGWRPDKARVDIPALRLEYAQALSRSDNPALAPRAQSLLKGLP